MSIDSEQIHTSLGHSRGDASMHRRSREFLLTKWVDTAVQQRLAVRLGIGFPTSAVAFAIARSSATAR
jgi:hypothetical protein